VTLLLLLFGSLCYFSALCYNHSFLHVHCSYANALVYLEFHTLRKKGTAPMHWPFLGFKFCPSFRAFASIWGTFLCSVSAREETIFILLAAHQLLMLFVGTLKYLKQQLVNIKIWLHIFLSNSYLLINVLMSLSTPTKIHRSEQLYETMPSYLFIYIFIFSLTLLSVIYTTRHRMIGW
jgi:hypothetical protein